MKTKKLIAGVSPFGTPSPLDIRPFNKIFDKAIDLNINGGIEIEENGEKKFVDVLILWGGKDIHPSIYNQKPHPCNQAKETWPDARDLVEWELLMQASENKIPIIGVCRGAQYICCFAGGSLWQDVDNHRNSSHEITTSSGEKFYPAADHHQMMNLLDLDEGKDYELLAWNSGKRATRYEKETMINSHLKDMENVPEPEVVYFPRINALAIQPHPEWEPVGSEFVNYINNLILEKLYV